MFLIMTVIHAVLRLKVLRLVLTAGLLYGLILQGVLVEHLYAGLGGAAFGEICASTTRQSGHTSDFSHHAADCLGLCTQSLMVAAPPVSAMFPFPDANMFRPMALRRDVAIGVLTVMGFQARGPPQMG